MMLNTHFYKKVIAILLFITVPFILFAKDYSATGYGKDPTSAKLSSVDELVEIIKKDFFNNDSDLYNNFDLRRIVNGATFTSPNDTGSQDINQKYRITATISENYVRSSIISQNSLQSDNALNNNSVNNNVVDNSQTANIVNNTNNTQTSVAVSVDNSVSSSTNTPTNDSSNLKFDEFMARQRENEDVRVVLSSFISVEETKDLYLTWDVGFKFFKPFRRNREYPFVDADLVFGPVAGLGLFWTKGINFNVLIFPSFIKKTLFEDQITRTNLGTKYFRTYGEAYLAYRFTWGSMDTSIGLGLGTDFDYFSEFFLLPKAILSIPVPALHPAFDFVNFGVGGKYTFMSNDESNARAWALNIEITLGGLF